VAADLLAGNDDVRPLAAGMLRRALGAIPGAVIADLAGVGGDEAGRARAVPRLRADAGYFTGDLAHAAVTEAGQCSREQAHGGGTPGARSRAAPRAAPSRGRGVGAALASSLLFASAKMRRGITRTSKTAVPFDVP
jgi:hypothetical protein